MDPNREAVRNGGAVRNSANHHSNLTSRQIRLIVRVSRIDHDLATRIGAALGALLPA